MPSRPEPASTTNSPAGKVGAGVKVYGYSIFAYDVTGSGNDLLDWNDFSKKTNNNSGGLDMLAFTGLIQCNPIPEPAALSLLGLGSLALLRRRRRA